MIEANPLAIGKLAIGASGARDARTRVAKSAWMRRATLAAALALAFAAGAIAGRGTLDQAAHVAGACIALEMAQAHGAIDEPRRKRIIYSLTSAANPHVDRFPVTRNAMLAACRDVRAAAWTNR